MTEANDGLNGFYLFSFYALSFLSFLIFVLSVSYYSNLSDATSISSLGLNYKYSSSFSYFLLSSKALLRGLLEIYFAVFSVSITDNDADYCSALS